MTIAARHILTPGFAGKRTSPTHGLSGIGRWLFRPILSIATSGFGPGVLRPAVLLVLSALLGTRWCAGAAHGYGVKTGAAALCRWTADAGRITLNADVRSGGAGVQLGQRKLAVATLLCRRGTVDETAFAAAQAFCKLMSPKPRLAK